MVPLWRLCMKLGHSCKGKHAYGKRKKSKEAYSLFCKQSHMKKHQSFHADLLLLKYKRPYFKSQPKYFAYNNHKKIVYCEKSTIALSPNFR